MPGSFSNFAENKILDHLFGGTPFAVPTLHVGYFLTGCDDNGPGAEPSSGSYARVAVPPATWLSSTAQQTQNVADIVCPRSTDAQGDVVGIGLFDSSVGGNFLAYFPAEDGILIEKRDSLVILAGGLIHQFNPGGFTNYTKDLILNHVYKGIPLPNFPVLYAGYMTTAPSDALAGTEPSAGGHLRQPVANNGSSYAPTSGGVKLNSIKVEFPVVTAAGGLGNAGWFGWWTAATGGQFIAYGPMTPPQNMALNSQLIFLEGDLQHTLD